MIVDVAGEITCEGMTKNCTITELFDLIGLFKIYKLYSVKYEDTKKRIILRSKR